MRAQLARFTTAFASCSFSISRLSRRPMASSTFAAPVMQPNNPAEVDQQYRPFLLSQHAANDWVASLELDGARAMVDAFAERKQGRRLRILVLYGSLRERSFSKLMAYEAARILHCLGADVRVYNPAGLPIKDEVSDKHAKVVELRSLSEWSDGHFWCSPEQHGNLTACFKNQSACAIATADAGAGAPPRSRLDSAVDRQRQANTGPDPGSLPDQRRLPEVRVAAVSFLVTVTLRRCAASTRSTACACSAAGCACGRFRTRARYQRVR